MAMDDTSIRDALRAESGDFRKLEEEHSRLDKKLIALSLRQSLTPDDEMEEKRLKKIKLRLKDEMYRMIRQYATSQEGPTETSASGEG